MTIGVVAFHRPSMYQPNRPSRMRDLWAGVDCSSNIHVPKSFIPGARTENTVSTSTCCVMDMSNVMMGQMRIQKFVMSVPRKKGGL